MRKKRTYTTLSILLLTLALLLSSCQGAAEPMETGETTEATTTTPPVIKKVYTYQYLTIEDIKVIDGAFVFMQPGYEVLQGDLEYFKDIGCTKVRAAGSIKVEDKKCHVYAVDFDNPFQSKEYALDVMRTLEQRDDVYKVLNDYSLTLPASVDETDSPNDFFIDQQWGIQQISLPSAWGINTGSNSVRVGVIDSGIKEPF